MRMLATVLFLFVVISPSFGNPGYGKILIDSAHQVALSAKIPRGVLKIRAGDEARAAALARDQVMYVVGFLNGYGGGANIAKAVIKIGEITHPTAEMAEVNYTAEFTVAWPRQMQAPSTLNAVLPLRTDAQGKHEFFQSYGARCQSGDEPADAGTFFYFYRPLKNGCPLTSTYDTKVAVPVRMELAPSVLQTNNKAPEYRKVWEDKKLVVTMIFGTYADGATSDNDVGVISYNQVYQELRRFLGNPVWANVPLGPQDAPGLRYPDIEMTFQYAGGTSVNFNMLLIQKSALYKPTDAFLERYEARTQISDYLSYNGHSGLGANIRALSKLGVFSPGQYQLFLINGCDTFTYVDGSLEAAVAKVNPGAKGTKFLDLITNANPSPFNGFAQNTLSVMRALFGGKATYRQMLSSFAPSQGALVSGEEDNS